MRRLVRGRARLLAGKVSLIERCVQRLLGVFSARDVPDTATRAATGMQQEEVPGARPLVDDQVPTAGVLRLRRLPQDLTAAATAR